MALKRILVTRILPPKAQLRIASDSRISLLQWTKDCAIPSQTLKDMIPCVDGALILLTDKIDASVLEAAGPQLKVVSTMSVGYDHIDMPAVKQFRPDLKIGITPDVLTDASAELTIALLLATARRFKEAIRVGESGNWGDWNPTFLTGTQISGKVVGIIGFGRIGQAVATRLTAFQPSKILYSSPTPKPGAEANIGSLCRREENLKNLLNIADVVIVTCKLTAETRGMFNMETFGWMKRDAIFINTARGGIVKHDDLFLALSKNTIGAAGLDVTDPEPFPADHPLHELPNCLILPHIGSATMETREAMADLAVSNVLAGVFDETLPASVAI